MKRHAFLIIAHRDFYILGKIMELLDDERCDFFLHIDKDAPDVDLSLIRSFAKKSGLFFAERKSIKWGGYSQVDCEMRMLRLASSHGTYCYYHLLSGADMPIKTKEEIFSFFDKNDGREFIHFTARHASEAMTDRIKYYHLNDLYAKPGTGLSKLQRSIVGLLDNGFLSLQKLFSVNRIRRRSITVMYGANWFSITDMLCRYILARSDEIKKTYRLSACADEVFLQTAVYSSPFRDSLYLPSFDNDYRQAARCIDWSRGNPYIFRKDDLEELISSDFMFARKFDTQTDREIIDRLFERLYK